MSDWLSTAAMFAGLATLTGLPMTASAAPLDAEVAPEIVSAMRRDLGLTELQVHQRLAFEARAPQLEKAAREQLGTAFGGAWLDAAGSALIVGVTDEAAETKMRLDGVRTVRVARSLARLEEVKAELDKNVQALSPDIHSWNVDLPTNSVVVYADTSGQSKRRVDDFLAVSSGLKDGTVRVVHSAHAPEPAYDLRGGEAYYFGNSRCSVGFPVNGGFVTAGHCGGVGTATFGHNRVSQGTVRGSVWPGADYAWVGTNGSWTPQPWVYNYAGGNVVVHGSNEAAVNASICRSGSTTQWRCGVLQAKNITVNYSVGPVYGLTRTNACAAGGDSGGSVLSGNQAQGVTSGVAGTCYDSSNPQTFYQPINPILRAYGLTLRTSGGGGGGGQSFVSRMNGKCIDVPNSNFSDGVQLQMWNCNGTNAQRWSFVNGTLQAGGKCMDVAWGSTANGAAIQLANCSGNRAQQFVLSGAGDLVSVLANKCVDIANHNSNDGARLVIYECSGNSNQKWDYR
ncbi:ricin-type beta-trefoil lectin domain protein [Comamonas sp. JC664]|uniref:ricin-type beta-trefoil lectin domain protein n=1 Tax=Comamonas sp. JC664 TaxID=2801917 RepID=UPI00191EB4CB|nr:ricin-type beta-trefoil lectin domain protein [Comamonas sp. JC664]MBL0695639.1 ricin-type beta-trefoil lectin domain protein [Comamonas sp. JC664]